MTFTHFKELTDLMVKQTERTASALQLGIELYDFTEQYADLVHKLWSCILTDHGFDWFMWFMYEKDYVGDGVGRADLTAHDDETPICEDLKGLYEYLVKNNYFKVPITDAKA